MTKKTITRAYVHAAGDPSAGIPSAYIEVELDLELEGDAQDIAERETELVEALSHLGLAIWGEKPLVHLDIKGNPAKNLQAFTVNFFTAQADLESGYRVLRRDLRHVELGWESVEAFDTEGRLISEKLLAETCARVLQEEDEDQ